MRIRNLQIQFPDHRKSLRAGDLVNQMRADEQLRLPILEIADRVRVPDFLEERFAHFIV